MHHIYHTKGFVLSSWNMGEANKLFYIYTKDLGLIRATAQGIRLNKSKLRFSLQNFSYSNIDLVRGKDMWRITSAKNISSFPFLRSDSDSLILVARVSKLLERLCTGEESNKKIFENFIQALHLLDNTSLTKESKEALEIHLVLNVLNSLGYIGHSDLLNKYLSSPFDVDLTENVLKDRKSIVTHINRAISESQL